MSFEIVNDFFFQYYCSTIFVFRPLFFVGMKVFKEFDICEVLDVEETVIASWLKLMERHYHQQNSYHNSTHAADVLQATTYFINILQDLLVSQGVSFCLHRR